MVSIVIPAYGKLPYTLACLRSVAQHGAQAPFEVIVVDDASPDDSAPVLERIEGLRLLRNTRNLGFVGSCNAGATAAGGQFLLFLNNDTQVSPGWLDALLRCFAERADCGIAGSRLVYPDGRLQEAGGTVFADGSCWNYGRFERRDAPAFTYRRRVDYVSGAALLIRSQLFRQLGGFDERYAPGYYEDTDLAFAARQVGLAVYYEPTSLVVHCEGISAGTDPALGMKRHQAPNQAKFTGKWTAELAAQPPPGTALGQAIRWRSRGRVLVVDATTPDPARDSGSMRLCAILRLLDAQGWSVSFAPDDGRADPGGAATLSALGCELLASPWIKSLPAWLREHGPELHAVLLCRHTVAGQYVTLVRRHAPRARLLFDTVDLHFLREQRAAEFTANTQLRHQAEATRRSELALIAAADVSFVVSPHERALLATLAPTAHVELLSNIHEVDNRAPGYGGRRDLVFIGGCNHAPNLDAMRWIAAEILPSLRSAFPGIIVHLLGDMPAAVRRELAQPGLACHGRVADLTPWLDGCLASIAPLRFGAGVKGKINMAMSHGVPVIATPIAVEGMQLREGIDVLVAQAPGDFVAAVARLRVEPRLWEQLSANGRANVREYFSPAAAAAALQRALP
jgi:GT2 family glycosyltransferase/glycosyltransferase involved in cell wall biosynthesis